jgi:DNA-directed RNA polymerase specialized sigma24 family protein
MDGRARRRTTAHAAIRSYVGRTLSHLLVPALRLRPPPWSLDWQTADTQFQIATTAEPSPDKAFDREWALTLLERVIVRLRGESVMAGKGEQFDQLKIFLMAGKDALSHAEAAESLCMDEGAVRTAVHRLRKRCRQMLRDEIAQTLSDSAQVNAEMQALFGRLVTDPGHLVQLHRFPQWVDHAVGVGAINVHPRLGPGNAEFEKRAGRTLVARTARVTGVRLPDAFNFCDRSVVRVSTNIGSRYQVVRAQILIEHRAPARADRNRRV